MSAAIIRPEPSSLLTQLTERRMFILARPDKHPCDLLGRDTSALDPLTWLPPAEAAASAELLGLHVGIVLSEGCGLVCIDIDSALQPDGTWSPLAVELCEKFAGAYVEISLSGRGLHIFASYVGPLPKHRTRWNPPGAHDGLHAELYSCARYILTTGTQAIGDVRTDHTAALHALIAERFTPDESSRGEAEWTTGAAPQWSGPPDTEEGNVELIEKAKRSRSANAIFGRGASFADLFKGDPDRLQQAYPPQRPGEAWDASAADLALANMLAYWTGGNAERIERLMKLSALYRVKHERGDYMRSTVLEACRSAAQRGQYYNDGRKAPVNPNDPRPTIELKGGSLAHNVATLQSLVADRLYVRGGSLVRIGHAEQVANGKLVKDAVELGGTRRSLRQAVCIPVTADWLRLELMGLAQFCQHDERAGRFKPKDCPDEIASIIVKQGSWSAFAPLLTITSTPILRADLSVWMRPGYDAETGIFYQPTTDIPPVVLTPTRADAEAALARLCEPFDQFPYASPESRAVFVAHILTAVIRPSFATSPIFIYSAPIVASGKTLLSDMPAVIAQGVDYPAHHNYDEKEELKKVLFSSLLAGDTALTIDNLPEGIKIRSPVLANFTTSGTWAGRVLGLSKVVELPNRCTVTMTGNNGTPVGEIARRSLVSRLDVNAESARGRTFRIKNLRSYVRERRPQYIVDVLTIVRAYAFAGYPEVDARPLESFEEWSRLVRDPLMWLGIADAVKSQEAETDDEVGPLRGAFAAIAAATYAQEFKFTREQLAALTIPQAPTMTGLQTAGTLREALIAAGCKEPSDPTALGYWLRGKRDNIAAGRKLVNEIDPHTRVATWHLRAV